jgi:uracil-DNA glycosylase
MIIEAPMSGADPQDVALQLLAWYREMGVDVALDAHAIDWTARGNSRPGADFVWPAAQPVDAARPVQAGVPPVPLRGLQTPSSARPALDAPAQPAKTPSRAPPVIPNRQFPTAAPDAAVLAARAAAHSAKDLDALKSALAVFDGCALKATAKSLCFYRGAAQSRLMLIGDAPTSDDDQQGKPLAGAEGQLLDRMLAAIGLAEADVHIATSVYWRPPGNRRPTAVELAVCRPFLNRQIELVAPQIIVMLGELPVQHLFDSADKIMKVRGTWRDLTVSGRVLRVLPMLHPSYLLKSPAAKRLAWADLRLLKSALEGGA